MATTAAKAVPTARATAREDDFRSALDRALSVAAGDETIVPALETTNLRMRFVFPDCRLSLTLAAEAGEGLRWAFDEDPEWSPEVELQMESTVANRYLQGRESLAIAIARGEAKFRGHSKLALLYLPATQLLAEPYRRVVKSDFPELLES